MSARSISVGDGGSAGGGASTVSLGATSLHEEVVSGARVSSGGVLGRAPAGLGLVGLAPLAACPRRSAQSAGSSSVGSPLTDSSSE